LGQGDQVSRDYPVQVTLPGAVSQITAGADVTCAHVNDNVFCWGSNNSGQVGIGTPRQTPTDASTTVASPPPPCATKPTTL
ncbi:MAG: hypothetical protein JKY37_13845, partial [Nannocystaceae bacterium]|nr:hypothetical protein [Nannocystaceae bacterium]